MPWVKCDYCGDPCYRTNYNLARNKGGKAYCGTECYRDAGVKHGGPKSRTVRGLRKCSECGVRKPLEEYYTWIDHRPKHVGTRRWQPQCKKCKTEIDRMNRASSRTSSSTNTKYGKSWAYWRALEKRRAQSSMVSSFVVSSGLLRRLSPMVIHTPQ